MIISLDEWLKINGYESAEDALPDLIEYTMDGAAPALCNEECEVEPDGHCEHGAPSILLHCGLL